MVASGYKNQGSESLLRKLALGTVQWGMSYGIANRTGQTSIDEVENIVELAVQKGIGLLDSAAAYGEAEQVLGSLSSVNQFKIVTKTQPITTPVISSYQVKLVAEMFMRSLQRLHRTSVFGLLVHSADNLLVKNGEYLWKLLTDFREKGLVDKIGVSVYHPEQAERILDQFPIELIQLPMNIYDQRFLRTGMLSKLKAEGVEVHVRSAFLQGLLLMSADQLPDYFYDLKEHHRRLCCYLEDMGISRLRAALCYTLGQQEVDYVVVGAESRKQLEEILIGADCFDFDHGSLDMFEVEDLSLLDPSRWPKFLEN